MNNTNNRAQIIMGVLCLLLLVVIFWWSGNSEETAAEPAADISDVVLNEAADNVVAVDSAVSAGIADLDELPAERPQVDMDALAAAAVAQDTAIVPSLNPNTFKPPVPAHAIETYVVARGDTPNKIAERFSIQPSTLLGGNPWLSQESSLLQAGVEIQILPIDGVLHDVALGDTLDSISTLYNIPADDIISYTSNNLEFPYRLVPESQIVVPGAVRELFVWTPPKLPERARSNGVVGTGTFVLPVRVGCVSQYYQPWHPGLDVAMPVGNPIYAMDTGTVSYGSWASGSYYDYGNLIVINHGNGYETFYAHLSGINVFPGQVVRQGQLIGYTGNTGNSSGPHIHVEIRFNNFRSDPTALIQGAYTPC